MCGEIQKLDLVCQEILYELATLVLGTSAVLANVVLLYVQDAEFVN